MTYHINVPKGSSTIIIVLPDGGTLNIALIGNPNQSPFCADMYKRVDGETIRTNARVFDQGITHFITKKEEEKATLLSIDL